MALAGLILASLSSSAAERQGKPAGFVGSPRHTFEKVEEDVATTVFGKVSKSVVTVEALTPDQKVQGSGVVYDITFFALEDPRPLTDVETRSFSSLVVTNAHVVKNANRVSVTRGSRQYKASIEYVDDVFDLAFLRVDGVVLSDSLPFPGTEVRVGQKVFAVGSPLGFENTISEGIISGVREQDGVTFLQTTAPISAGSSGGGLFDGKGGLVGITTFKSRGGENLNFAVDVNHVAEFIVARFPIYELRYVASISLPGLSPAQMGIINSRTFVEWLLNVRDENGKKLYVRLARQLNDVMSAKADSSAFSAGLESFANESAQILNRFFKEQGSKAAITQNTPNVMLLVCSVMPPSVVSDLHPEYRGVRQDISLKLDYTKKTVNGNAATITDAEVAWRWNNTKGNEYFAVLNRYSGSILIRAKGLDMPLYSGQCSPARERKF
jgi:hypothetical protein